MHEDNGSAGHGHPHAVPAVDAHGADLLVDVTAQIFTLLADVTRLRIVLALHGAPAGELSVGSLAQAVGRKPAGVSQHLAKLRTVHVVSTRQEGTTVFYRLTDEHAVTLVHEGLKQAEHAVHGVGAHGLSHRR